MLGMKLIDSASGVSGTVDAQTVHPDGKALVRINDRWLEVQGLVSLPQL